MLPESDMETTVKKRLRVASSIDGYALPVLSQRLGIDLAELERRFREAMKSKVIPAAEKVSLLQDLEFALLEARRLGLKEVVKVLEAYKKAAEGIPAGRPINISRYTKIIKDRGRARQHFTYKLNKRFGKGAVAVFSYHKGRENPYKNYEKVEEFKGFVLGRVSDNRFILLGPDVRLIKKKPYYLGEKLLGEWVVDPDKRSRENT